MSLGMQVGIARFTGHQKGGRNMIAHIVKSPENFELTIIYNTHIVKHSDKIQTLNGIQKQVVVPQ